MGGAAADILFDMHTSPTAEGFKLISRRPVIFLAEVAWRWALAVAGWFLAVFFLIEFADSLPVHTLDRILLDSNQPILVLRAIRRIVHGSASRFTEAGVLLGIGLLVAWIVVGALGRLALVKVLLEELGVARSNGSDRSAFYSLLALNFMRAAVMLAAAVCAIGALMISGSAWASTRASMADSARLGVAVLFLTWMAWNILNWLLATASIFAVTEREGALDAIFQTVRACQLRPEPWLTAATWFGLAHVAIFVVAGFASVMLIGAIGTLRPGPVMLLELMLALLYCALADFLSVGRVAAYVAIIRGEGSVPLQGLDRAPSPPTSAVDRGELILSDLPQPAW